MLKLIKFIIFAILISLNFANAEGNHEEIFNNLKNKINNLKSVQFDFTVKNQGLSGKLYAKIGNKYQVILNDRIITCNGKTIWNFSKSKNQVMISNLEEMSSQASLQDVLFHLISKYKPFAAVRENNSKTGQSILLKLKSDSEKSDIDEVHVWLDDDNNIKSVGANLNGNYEVWTLSKLNLNPNIQDTKFDFKIPDKVEVIDLR